MHKKWEDLNLERYCKYINNIVEIRGQWSEMIRYCEEGCHRHHIKFRCFGGLPKYSNWSHHANITWLTKSEHLEAHRILYEDNNGNEQCIGALNKTQILCNSKVTVSPRLGKHFTDQERIKISIGVKKGMSNPEVREKCKSQLGKPRTDVEKEHISKGLNLFRAKVKGSDPDFYNRVSQKVLKTKAERSAKDPDYYINVSLSKRGKKNPMYGKPARNRVALLDTSTGIVYETVTKAMKECINYGDKRKRGVLVKVNES